MHQETSHICNQIKHRKYARKLRVYSLKKKKKKEKNEKLTNITINNNYNNKNMSGLLLSDYVT